MPNRLPSVNRVLAFQYTAAESTPAWNRRAASASRATIASLCPLPCRLMCAMASSRESTTATPMIRARNSVSQSPAVASRSRVATSGGASARTRSSTRSSTPRASRARRMRGKNAPARSWCTSSFSAALQTAGRWVFALIAMLSAMSGSAEAST